MGRRGDDVRDREEAARPPVRPPPGTACEDASISAECWSASEGLYTLEGIVDVQLPAPAKRRLRIECRAAGDEPPEKQLGYTQFRVRYTAVDIARCASPSVSDAVPPGWTSPLTASTRDRRSCASPMSVPPVSGRGLGRRSRRKCAIGGATLVRGDSALVLGAIGATLPFEVWVTARNGAEGWDWDGVAPTPFWCSGQPDGHFNGLPNAVCALLEPFGCLDDAPCDTIASGIMCQR